jgi:hypothetical protein
VQAFGLVQTLTIVLQVKHGRGRHIQRVETDDYNDMLMVGLPICNALSLLTSVVQLDQHVDILRCQLVLRRLPINY